MHSNGTALSRQRGTGSDRNFIFQVFQGSQFFITLSWEAENRCQISRSSSPQRPQPWLDGKHAIFGRVKRGSEGRSLVPAAVSFASRSAPGGAEDRVGAKPIQDLKVLRASTALAADATRTCVLTFWLLPELFPGSSTRQSNGRDKECHLTRGTLFSPQVACASLHWHGAMWETWEKLFWRS